MAGWGGEWRFPRFATSVNDGGHGNRLIGALQTLPRRLLPVHQRLQEVAIEERDWRDCLLHYDSPETVAYLDPPYPGNSCNYSQNMRDWRLHESMARTLAGTQCRWVLSSYDHPQVRTLYAPFTIIPVQFYSGMKPEKGAKTRTLNREVLIINFAPPGAASR
jgi:DNA adenine methylase